MRVLILCPAPRGSRSGNRRTAERWARLLRQLGHVVRIAVALDTRARADVVVALHAGRMAEAIGTSRALAPSRPIVVALTGTDLSHDIRVEPKARASLAIADRLVVLHDLAEGEVPPKHRAKVRVIRQSAQRPRGRVAKSTRAFEIAVVGHLRDVKDPFRAALAARRLPRSSRARVLHAGRALEPAMRSAARREERANARYVWRGELSPAQALRLIARARLLVLTSQSEGGANVLGEAAMCGTPVVSSDIPAARAALGADYPGLFRVGDDAALARLLDRAERDPSWLAALARRVRARRPLFAERAEREAWRVLLAEVTRTD